MEENTAEPTAEDRHSAASTMPDRSFAGSIPEPSAEPEGRGSPPEHSAEPEGRGSPPDTKTQIFNVALRLFAASGVENVSMRDIATAVGIKAASIYNHYASKEQIVEACYDFYLKYHDTTRLNKEQYTIVLQKGTKEEIVNVPNNQFPPDLAENLFYAMTVLFSRMYTDAKAIEKYTKMIDYSLEFLKDFFELGIELGRFEKFNVRAVSLLFLSSRLLAAQSITIHPDALLDWGIAQQEMMLELINNIPFKY